MERLIFEKLHIWKNSDDRKPLVLKGARQVGKTWIMKEYGQKYYQNYVYFNFDENESLGSIFESNKNPHRIIELLALISGEVIKPGDTLIIFDEVQECPEALNSLKYFNENANEYHIIAAGSLLGTLLAAPKSYPVGKVNTIEVGPMNFEEFLLAVDEGLYKYYITITANTVIEEIFHQRLLESYRYYLIIGGMPECVASWIKYKDPEKVLRIQKELIALYENDFSKHNGKVKAARILMVFRSVVSQLAKENEKFVYGVIKEGARAREFEEAIEWLVSAGLVNRVYNVAKPEHPLPAYDKLDAFKIYLFDTGLLKCMAGVENSSILLESNFQFKGVLAENYVLQQLNNKLNVEPRYYSTKTGELDFLLQIDENIVPVEVKAGGDKGAPTFKKYIAERKPALAVRFSERGYIKNGEITNIPLYLANNIGLIQ